MELWLWVISGVMWFIAASLVGLGIWRLSTGLRWLRRAEKYLKGDWLDEAQSKFLDIKSKLLDIEIKFVDTGKKLLEETRDAKQERNGVQKVLDIVDDGSKKADDSLKDVDGDLKKVDEDREFWRHVGNIREVTGTRDIALAAAFFAGASVVVGISGVLIALFTP